jgi:putative transposase
MTQEQLNQLQEKTLKQFKKGEPLFGKGGAFAPLLKRFLEAALEAEMEAHLNEVERGDGNKRNGKGRKTIKSHAGSFEIETPQDRHSSFDPQIIRERETILADNLQDKIIGLYGLGMSYRDISSHIKEMYDTNISTYILQQITDRIIPEVKVWQDRPLDPTYPILWLDAMHFKVRDQSQVKSKALYNILAINSEGKKELLGVYLSESEGAKFWLQILTQLQNRGLKDILIACTDNLKGFSEAIASIYPKTEIQSCIVHQIRNSIKYVASKDKKEFAGDLKSVYKASTKELAEVALEKISLKWQAKYPVVIKSWQVNWDKLSTYFAYSESIRRLIYTTNPIEGYHRQVRKITKTKSSFSSDMALLKLVYLASRNIAKKWTTPVPNWGLAVQQLFIKFGDRMPIDLPTQIMT